LQGNWREEHLFALQQAVKAYEFHRRQLTRFAHLLLAG